MDESDALLLVEDVYINMLSSNSWNLIKLALSLYH
jgi:hypothetical protein